MVHIRRVHQQLILSQQCASLDPITQARDLSQPAQRPAKLCRLASLPAVVWLLLFPCLVSRAGLPDSRWAADMCMCVCVAERLFLTFIAMNCLYEFELIPPTQEEHNVVDKEYIKYE
jgi:hypothetical protein